MMDNEFGKYMQQLRESHGFGVNQLAQKAHVSGSEVSRIESGERKRPHPDTLLKLARALKHPVEDFYERLGYLVGETDDPAPPKNDSLSDSIETIAANRGRINVEGLEDFEKEAREKLEEVIEYLLAREAKKQSRTDDG